MVSAAKVIVDRVKKDMEQRPEDFTCGQYKLDDSATRLSYWVANGWHCAGVYSPFKQRFGLIQGFRFHRALKRWKAREVIRRGQRALSARDTGEAND